MGKLISDYFRTDIRTDRKRRQYEIDDNSKKKKEKEDNSEKMTTKFIIKCRE